MVTFYESHLHRKLMNLTATSVFKIRLGRRLVSEADAIGMSVKVWPVVGDDELVHCSFSHAINLSLLPCSSRLAIYHVITPNSEL